ncbi:MAG: hypothetical protein QOI49_1534 [Verrucomicrobiota bacterium]|jgi:hypothetical protein
MKLLPNIGAAALLTSLLTIGGNVFAGPCTVPGSYPTIQQAVNDVTCDPIYVGPGAYNENVTVARSVTIYGAQAAQPFGGRTSGGANESTVNGVSNVGSSATFTISAADVMIDGFTIKNNANVTGAANGVVVKSPGNAAVIANNIFDMISTADTTANGTAQAVYLENGPDGVTINNNEMKSVRSNRSAKGVLIGDSHAPSASDNVEVKGNYIHDIISDTRGAYGVSMGNIIGASGLKVLENRIDGLTGGGWVHAIGLEGDTPGVIVEDNTISNLVDATPTIPSDSLCVWFESNPSFGSANVHTNNFNVTNASFGIRVHPDLVTAAPSARVNGTCNWWNSPTGPTAASNPSGTGAMVSSGVNYVPWLTAMAPSNTCGGGLPQPTTAGQCKNGGWQNQFRADGSTFKNQGDCIQYVNTGK